MHFFNKAFFAILFLLNFQFAFSSKQIVNTDAVLAKEISSFLKSNLALNQKPIDLIKVSSYKKSEKYTNFVKEMLQKPEVQNIGKVDYEVEVIIGNLSDSFKDLHRANQSLELALQNPVKSPAFTYFCKDTNTYKIFMFKEYLTFLKNNASAKIEDLIHAILLHEVWFIASKYFETKQSLINSIIKGNYAKIESSPTIINFVQLNQYALVYLEIFADCFVVQTLKDSQLVIEVLEQLFAFLESIGYFYESSQVNLLFNSRISCINEFKKLEFTESEIEEIKELAELAKRTTNYVESVLSSSVVYEENSNDIVNEIVGSSILNNYCEELPNIVIKSISSPNSNFKNWIFFKEGFSPSCSQFNPTKNRFEIYLLHEFFDSIKDQETKENVIKIAVARELSGALLNSNYFASKTISEVLKGLNKINSNYEKEKESTFITGVNLILLKMNSLVMDICAVEILKNKKAFLDYLEHLNFFLEEFELGLGCLEKLINNNGRRDIIMAAFPEGPCSTTDLNK